MWGYIGDLYMVETGRCIVIHFLLFYTLGALLSGTTWWILLAESTKGKKKLTWRYVCFNHIYDLICSSHLDSDYGVFGSSYTQS